MSRPAAPPTPKLPRLQSSSPLGAWLTRHLFKAVAALLLLLTVLLAWLLETYGFQIGADGLTRTDSVQQQTVSFELSGIGQPMHGGP